MLSIWRESAPFSCPAACRAAAGVDDGLGLGQVQLAVEKGPLGEFTGPGQACPGRAQGV